MSFLILAVLENIVWCAFMAFILYTERINNWFIIIPILLVNVRFARNKVKGD